MIYTFVLGFCMVKISDDASCPARKCHFVKYAEQSFFTLRDFVTCSR